MTQYTVTFRKIDEVAYEVAAGSPEEAARVATRALREGIEDPVEDSEVTGEWSPVGVRHS